MAEILETIMLICFGCSWPMNAYKNAKAKSAKNMSLSFTIHGSILPAVVGPALPIGLPSLAGEGPM